MKNLNKYATNIKLLILGCILLILFIAPGCGGLHQTSNQIIDATARVNSDILIGPGECVLKKFQGTSVNNKFYLYWVFQSNSNQFFFQIESSVNGKKFRPCYFKQGAGSPGTASLMLCMTDSVNKNDVVFYRIKAIPENYSIKSRIEQDYKGLFDASTIMVSKNKRTKGYMQDDAFYTNGLEAVNR